MARSADENSANSQFFIVFYPRFSLDRRYTNFGRVIGEWKRSTRSTRRAAGQSDQDPPGLDRCRQQARNSRSVTAPPHATITRSTSATAVELALVPSRTGGIAADSPRDYRARMRVDLFDFELPPERIALRPARPRDAARLLLVPGRRLRGPGVRDLPRCCARATCWCSTTPGHSRPARRRRGEARIGATCTSASAQALAGVRAQRQAVREGDRIAFAPPLRRSPRNAIRRQLDAGLRRRRAGRGLLERAGQMPLPPYIAGKRATDAPTATITRRCSRARGRGRRADRRAALHPG
jgi:hypothetical protein